MAVQDFKRAESTVVDSLSKQREGKAWFLLCVLGFCLCCDNNAHLKKTF